jgi:digeranylgeranylglycerophospholipid reductase
LKPEVAVVGAGPAGLLAATRIAERGFSVQVFEEHRAVGEPSHCAGLISVEGLRRLGLEPREEFIQGKVYGGHVYAPNGEHMELKDSRPRAYVVNRSAFDRHLAEKAVEAGVDLHVGERVEAIEFIGGSAALKLRWEKVEPKVVVDAEGPGARLLTAAGVNSGQIGLLNGFNVEVTGVEAEPGMVELWFGDETARGFFAWVIPLGGDSARCGLASADVDGLKRLRGFIERRYGDCHISKIRAGRVCVGGPIKKTVHGNLLLVGDSAGQVKATTGGGVVVGGLCAVTAGDSAADHLQSGKPLAAYERRWRRLVGSELNAMFIVRRLMDSLRDERLDRLLRAFVDEGLQGRLQSLMERGDMDMQAGVIREALSDPAILATLLRCLGRVALSESLSLLQP